MAQVVGSTGAGTPRKDFYIRLTAAYTRPTDLAGVATLLATAVKMGLFDDKTKKNSIKKDQVRPLCDASEFVQLFGSNVEGDLANCTDANVDDFNSTYDNVSCDVILDDTVKKQIKVYKAHRIHGEEDEIDGDKEVLRITGTSKASTKAALLDRFSYAAFI